LYTHYFIIQIIHIISMSTVLEEIKEGIFHRPNVTTERHKFGSIEFRLNNKETGHTNGDHLADFPLSTKTINELVNSGRESPHCVMPQSGWVSYWIEKGEEDLAAIVELYRSKYQQLKPNHRLSKKRR